MSTGFSSLEPSKPFSCFPSTPSHRCQTIATTVVISALAALTAAAGIYLLLKGVNSMSTFIPGIILTTGGSSFELWAVILAVRSVRKPIETKKGEEKTPDTTESEQTIIIVGPKQDKKTENPKTAAEFLIDLTSFNKDVVDRIQKLSDEGFKDFVVHFSSQLKRPDFKPNALALQNIWTALHHSKDRLAKIPFNELGFDFLNSFFRNPPPGQPKASDYKEMLLAYSKDLVALSQEQYGPIFALFPQFLVDFLQDPQNETHRSIWEGVYSLMKTEKTIFLDSLTDKEVISLVFGKLWEKYEGNTPIPPEEKTFLKKHFLEAAAIFNQQLESDRVPRIEFFDELSDANGAQAAFLAAINKKGEFLELYFSKKFLGEKLDKKTYETLATQPEILADLFKQENAYVKSHVNAFYEAMSENNRRAFVAKLTQESPKLHRSGSKSSQGSDSNGNSIARAVSRIFSPSAPKRAPVETDFIKFLKLRLTQLTTEVNRKDPAFEQFERNFEENFPALIADKQVDNNAILKILHVYVDKCDKKKIEGLGEERLKNLAILLFTTEPYKGNKDLKNLFVALEKKFNDAIKDRPTEEMVSILLEIENTTNFTKYFIERRGKDKFAAIIDHLAKLVNSSEEGNVSYSLIRLVKLCYNAKNYDNAKKTADFTRFEEIARQP